MKNFYRVFLAGFIALAMSASAAMAFQGFSIGVTASGNKFSTAGTETEGGGDSEKSTEGTATEMVALGSAFIEYTPVFGYFGLTIGIEHIPGTSSLGAKTRTDTDGGDASGEADTGDRTAKAEVSDLYTYYLEPTLVVGNAGYYLKGGLTTVDVKSLESLPNSTYDDPGNINGTMIGIGFKGTSEMGLGMKIELTHTNFDEISLTSSTGNLNTVTGDFDQTSGRVSIYYNF